MGLHIAWNGPQIYIQAAILAAMLCGIAYLVKRA